MRAQFGAEELVGNLAQVANNLAHTSQVRMQNQHSLEDKQVAQFTAVKERFHGQDKEINNIKVNQNALKSELAATHNTLAEMMHNYVREQLPSVLPRSIVPARTTTPMHRRSTLKTGTLFCTLLSRRQSCASTSLASRCHAKTSLWA